MPSTRPPSPPFPLPPEERGAVPEGEAAGELDEVGFAIGPDEGGGGLFDRSGTDATGTGEATASTSRPELASTAQRTALLAWLAADLPSVEPLEDTTLPGFEPALGPAVGANEAQVRLEAALRRALADEPPDPLPALDGVGGGVWHEAPRPTDRRDATATLVDESSTTGLHPAPEPPPAARLPEPPARLPAPSAGVEPLGGLGPLVAGVLFVLALVYFFAGR